MLSLSSPNSVILCSRPLGGGQFTSYPFSVVTPGRQVYNISLSPLSDIEYYVQAEVNGQFLYFPTAGPNNPHSVVVL